MSASKLAQVTQKKQIQDLCLNGFQMAAKWLPNMIQNETISKSDVSPANVDSQYSTVQWQAKISKSMSPGDL